MSVFWITLLLEPKSSETPVSTTNFKKPTFIYLIKKIKEIRCEDEMLATLLNDHGLFYITKPNYILDLKPDEYQVSS